MTASDKKTLRSTGRNISLLYRKAQAFLNSELRPYDLSSSEYIHIINIRDKESVRQKHLSEKLFIDNGLTTRCIQSLEKKGYIRRESDAKDGRALQISLTAKGVAVKPIIIGKLEKWAGILTAGMKTDEIALFNRLTESMVENISLYNSRTLKKG